MDHYLKDIKESTKGDIMTLFIELDEKGKIKRMIGKAKVRDIRKYGLIQASIKGGRDL